MLKAYPSFKMNVYKTRRTASAPRRIYEKTRELAAVAKLTPDGNGVEGGIGGVPLPHPQKRPGSLLERDLEIPPRFRPLLCPGAGYPRRFLYPGQVFREFSHSLLS